METRVAVHVHLEGPSRYHCDQNGDKATIALGLGYNVSVTASVEDFLLLSKTCQEAARRIALRKVNKITAETERELAEEFPGHEEEKKHDQHE